MAREQADIDAGHTDGGVDQDISGIVPQLQPTPGLPERQGARRRQERVMQILHTLPPRAREAILDSYRDDAPMTAPMTLPMRRIEVS